MCGISGYLLQQPGANSARLQAFATIQHHRGPDNRSHFADGGCVLIHNRLSILDLSENGNQPFENERYVLVYNGEIYNYLSLKSQLEQEGIHFRSTSDSEALFWALVRYGPQHTLARIEGMFAFALYDKQEKRLLVARDRLGIKPLFYALCGGDFYFSSEQKTLALNLDVKPLYGKAVFAMQGFSEEMNASTVFENIFQVSPGAYLSVRPGQKPEAERYFSLANLADQKLFEEQDKMSAVAVAERFGNLFGQSVERMLMSDAPMGVFLSGGVDSSLIAAVAAGLQKDISFFTANVVGPQSEVAYARQVAGHLGKSLYEAPFEHADMTAAWVDVTYHYEAPVIKHANSMPFARVAGLARQHGVKAVLTGEGSDELFLGYPGMVSNKLRNAALLPLELLEKIYQRIPGFANNIRKGNKLTLLRIFDNIIQDFHKQHVRAEIDSTFHFLPPQKRKEQALTLVMLTTHLSSLLWRNDRMGMMHSIESRFPFLDERLLRFAANLPLRFKVRNEARLHNWRHPFQVDKWVVRQMAVPLLPQAIVYKPKKGFPTDMMRKVQVDPDFFANGFVQGLFGIASPNLPLLKSTTDQYTVAKFAAMDIWGRLFVLRQPLAEVKERVVKYARL